jgi:hypothetical protein
MVRQYFEEQIKSANPITEEAYSKIEFKRVHSGEQIQIGDIVLFAFLKINDKEFINENSLMFTVLERELDILNNNYKFVDYYNETIPIFKLK